MRQVGVVVATVVRTRVDVDRDGAQPGHGVQHVVPRPLGHFMCLAKGQVGVGHDQRFGMDRVSDPARTHE